MNRYFFLYACVILTINSCMAQSKHIVDQIEYTASSRGSTIHITITPEKIHYKNNSVAIKSEDWETLIKSTIDFGLKNLDNYNAPSQDRFRDAALSTEIKIITKKNVFISNQFDHGNPPKELTELVKKILELAEIKE